MVVKTAVLKELETLYAKSGNQLCVLYGRPDLEKELLLKTFLQNKKAFYPGGESRAEFITRCKEGLLDCLMELEKQVTVQEKVVCIVHGGTIMALFDSYGQGSYFDYQCRCGQGYECTLSYAVDANGVVKETSISMRDEKLIFGE